LAGLAGLVLWLAVFDPGAPLFGAAPAATPPPSSREARIAAVKAERNDAIFQVQHIVNQPVARTKRTPDMVVKTYPGWFHPGAMTPDFNTVDVRTTREFPYEGSQYVTSDLNPGVVFLGRELEFNRLTKYFITDRSVPKKKLTEAEMVEINRQYRIIGHCDQQLEELQKPRTIVLGLDLTRVHDTIVNALQSPTGSSILGLISKYRYLLVAFVILLLLALHRVRQKRQAD
jgi:hypothetical protein